MNCDHYYDNTETKYVLLIFKIGDEPEKCHLSSLNLKCHHLIYENIKVNIIISHIYLNKCTHLNII